MLYKSTTCLVIGFFAFVFSGCSTRGWYEGLQEAQRQDCNRIESPKERQDCLERAATPSYDQYQRERENLKKPTEKK